jgi:hypothetical protein
VDGTDANANNPSTFYGLVADPTDVFGTIIQYRKIKAWCVFRGLG